MPTYNIRGYVFGTNYPRYDGSSDSDTFEIDPTTTGTIQLIGWDTERGQTFRENVGAINTASIDFSTSSTAISLEMFDFNNGATNDLSRDTVTRSASSDVD